MASTSNSQPTNMRNHNSIEQFCSITGADREKAAKMLEVCNWNIEMAINMHVDSNPEDDDDSKENENQENAAVATDSEVRAPIPPSRQVLVEGSYSSQFDLMRGTKRRPRRSIFDGLRDFEAEAEWQEQELTGHSSNSDAQKKRKTLEDLFRPPLDLMHRGSFETARERGQQKNKWLMVNVQDSQEFACQVLNRDVWSNPTVKAIVSEHFIFWQVHCDSAEGQRYVQFYRPIAFPYIAIIDPRTGENLVVWNKVDAVTFCDLISTFLSSHSFPDNVSLKDVPKPSAAAVSLLDVSEDQQMKAALEASLKDFVAPVEEEDEETLSEVETFESDSDSQAAKGTSGNSDSVTNDSELSFDGKIDDPNWEDFLGPDEDETTDLVLRMPDGTREKITWPCTSQMRALLMYTETLGYKQSKYELITNFPRRNLCEIPSEKTLKEIGLYPREMIFIQLKQ